MPRPTVDKFHAMPCAFVPYAFVPLHIYTIVPHQPITNHLDVIYYLNTTKYMHAYWHYTNLNIESHLIFEGLPFIWTLILSL